jgi:predicted nucleic-acid-binding protein
MRAVDTNVLVRALVRDDAAQAALAEALLGRERIFVPVTVILELEWVLRSRYGFAPKRVAQALHMLTTLGNVHLHERDAVVGAAARVAQGWDFADALHHALSAGCDDFVTFDADLARRAVRGADAQPPITKLS